MHDGDEIRPKAKPDPMAKRADDFASVTGAALPSNYSLIRKIGEGLMAHVFLARNTALKRLVAIKVLRRELAEDVVGRKRFVREAQAAARIHHPAVTTVYNVGTLTNDAPFIEMQYVDGRNLAEVLRAAGRFDVPTARSLLAQLAGALAAAHECRLIHRDVEPANVLVEPDNRRAYLTDFGVAGILETGSEAVTRLTREGDRLGDPTYMSPEQLRGEALTPQSDIYSLGLLGYEMLTLEGPFANAEVTDLAAAHIRREPLDLHTVHADIPADLSDILKRCLAKKPEHRPNARLLAECLESTGPGVIEALDEDAGIVASFLKELRQRKVYQAVATYAAAVFIILQGADLVLPTLTTSDWPYRITVVISLAAFPMIVAIAWVYDLRKGRLMRTDDADITGSRLSGLPRTVMQVGGLVLSACLSAVTAWWLLTS